MAAGGWRSTENSKDSPGQQSPFWSLAPCRAWQPGPGAGHPQSSWARCPPSSSAGCMASCT